jgi:uncharacterized protein (TIGR03435 family)
MSSVRVFLPLAPFLVAVSACVAQPAPPNLKFDVASVKRLPPDTPARNRSEFTPAGFEAETYMVNLISIAYEIPRRSVDASSEMLGVRGMSIPAYSISARSAGPVPPATLRLMVRDLLAERFQLKCHKEQRTEEVLALTVSKRGLKLRLAETSGQPQGLGFVSGGLQGYANMDTLASVMSGFVPLQVINQTGAAGVFHIVLQGRGEDGEIGNPLLNRSRAEERFRGALGDVGLELSRRKMPVERLVIDSMLTTPTSN